MSNYDHEYIYRLEHLMGPISGECLDCDNQHSSIECPMYEESNRLCRMSSTEGCEICIAHIERCRWIEHEIAGKVYNVRIWHSDITDTDYFHWIEISSMTKCALFASKRRAIDDDELRLMRDLILDDDNDKHTAKGYSDELNSYQPTEEVVYQLWRLGQHYPQIARVKIEQLWNGWLTARVDSCIVYSNSNFRHNIQGAQTFLTRLMDMTRFPTPPTGIIDWKEYSEDQNNLDTD